MWLRCLFHLKGINTCKLRLLIFFSLDDENSWSELEQAFKKCEDRRKLVQRGGLELVYFSSF